MKNLALILALIIATPAICQIQHDMFAGSWKYQNGNEVFIVDLWKTVDGYNGHYRKIMVDASGNQVSVVFDSNKPMGGSTTNWPYVISSGNAVQNKVGATIHDNTVSGGPNFRGFLEAKLKMQIINPGCYAPRGNTCPLQLQWTVTKDAGLQDPSDPGFSVPTNIILTKQ